MRLDRIALAFRSLIDPEITEKPENGRRKNSGSLSLQNIKLIGLHPAKKRNSLWMKIHPSDHFGLRASFRYEEQDGNIKNSN